MVKYELKGGEAEKVLKAWRRTQQAEPTVSADTDAYTFVVHSLSDVKAVAAYMKIDVPEGRGRFPMKRLEDALAVMGHRLDRSQYGESLSFMPGTYRVSLMELVGDKVYPRTGIVTGEQVKQYASGRGRPSKDAIASAAINVHGWGETYLSDSVQISRTD